jgi:hypothetical protein
MDQPKSVVAVLTGVSLDSVTSGQDEIHHFSSRDKVHHQFTSLTGSPDQVSKELLDRRSKHGWRVSRIHTVAV